VTELQFSLPAAYLRQVAEQVRELGADVELWLARAGLTPEGLEATADELPFELFEHLIVDALSMTREPALGLFVGQRLEVQMHGVLGYAAVSSGSLREALGVLETFLRTRISLVGLTLEPAQSDVRVRIDELVPLGAVQRTVLEAVSLAIKNLLDVTARGTCRFGDVSFPFPAPSYAPLARQLFGSEVRYGQSWAGLTLPRAALDVPLRAADPVAFREAVQICRRELELVQLDASFAGRVRRILLERQHSFPSQEIAARLLHLTPRTLHRRLVAEHTTFRQELEAVRHRLAIEHLKTGRIGLEELAYTLGYTDFANFRRAFKRWQAMPPSEYRRRHLKKAGAA